jgi:hypothetical protein
MCLEILVKSCKCKFNLVFSLGIELLETCLRLPNLGHWFGELLVSFLSNPNFWVFYLSVVL